MVEKAQDANTTAREAENGSSADGETAGSFLRFILLVALAALAFRSFAFSLFNIPSESMLPRLMNGDYLIASKWPYGYTSNSLPFDIDLIPGRWFASAPERGDIVIFKHPVDGSDYVKRAIGLPGDVVELQGGQVILNGEILPLEKLPDLKGAVSANTGCAWGASREDDGTGRVFCSYKRFRENLPGGRSYEVLDFGATPQDDYGPVRVPPERCSCWATTATIRRTAASRPRPAAGSAWSRRPCWWAARNASCSRPTAARNGCAPVHGFRPRAGSVWGTDYEPACPRNP